MRLVRVGESGVQIGARAGAVQRARECSLAFRGWMTVSPLCMVLGPLLQDREPRLHARSADWSAYRAQGANGAVRNSGDAAKRNRRVVRGCGCRRVVSRGSALPLPGPRSARPTRDSRTARIALTAFLNRIAGSFFSARTVAVID